MGEHHVPESVLVGVPDLQRLRQELRGEVDIAVLHAIADLPQHLPLLGLREDGHVVGEQLDAGGGGPLPSTTVFTPWASRNCRPATAPRSSIPASAAASRPDSWVTPVTSFCSNSAGSGEEPVSVGLGDSDGACLDGGGAHCSATCSS